VAAGELVGVLASPFAEFDRERRRIEAALHDGVQQDLVAASVAVQLALQLLEIDPTAARTALEELERQVVDSLERVRALAQEIYPSQLLTQARHPLAVEEAVYFSCRALGGEPRVWEEGGELRFEAAGSFADAAVDEVRIRIASVGGQVTVSAGGVTGAVPVSSSAR
jgi:hypothetical protein